MASLVLGMDFYEKEVYVGLWDEEERFTKSFTVPARSDGERIPLFVVPLSDGSCVAGLEGVRKSLADDIEGTSALYGKKAADKTVLNGREYDTTELLAGFLEDVLNGIRKCFAGAAFSRICITGEEMNADDERRLSNALRMLGYDNDRFFIINHANAFLMYIINTDELRRRQHVVGVDISADGIEAYYFNPADRTRNYPAYIERLEGSRTLKVGLAGIEDRRMRAEAFENIISFVLMQNRNLNCMYVTGKAAEDDCIKNVLRKYASPGLKIFSGQNLYSSGACYRAVNEKPRDNILSDGEVFHSVSVEGYRDATVEFVPLIEAGCPLVGAEKKIFMIPDNINNIVFRIRDYRNGHTEAVNFSLYGLISGENKTNRLEISVRFVDIKTLVIKVRDLGFGEIKPATFRVSEQTIML